MAKLRKGILGPFTGKIGTVVAVMRGNTVYIRALPRKSHKPQTAGQIAAREKFKLVNSLLSPMRPFIGAGFKYLALHKSAFDLAFTANYHGAILGVYPDLSIDYSQVVLSEGRLWPLKAAVMVLEATNILHLSWDVDWTPYSKIDDQVMLVLNCPALGFADGMINLGSRYLQECRFHLQPRMTGYEVDVYVALISKTGKHASKSQYMGRVTPI